MAGTTAEGQHDGIQPNAGPVNKFDGASEHPEVDGCGPLAYGPLRIRQAWQAGESASPASSFVLGKVPE